MLSEGRKADQRAAAATRHCQTTHVLASLFHQLKPYTVRPVTTSGEVTIPHAEKSLPDLRPYVVTVLCNNAASRASNPPTPEKVSMPNPTGSVEDRRRVTLNVASETVFNLVH